MTPEKCKNCPALIYPYRWRVDGHNRLLPKDEWLPTCKMNITRYFGEDNNDLRGIYGTCRPEYCEGPYGRRYRELFDEGKRVEFL